jgi:MFS family permease
LRPSSDFEWLKGSPPAVLPAVMGMIADMFTEDQRGRALGWWAGANGLGQAIGPTFGGVVVQVASWRWVFVPIVPLALSALVATIRLVPRDRGAGVAGPLEWRGAATLTSGAALVICSTVAVSQSRAVAAPVLAVLGVGMLSLVVVTRRAPTFLSPQLVREPSYLRSRLPAQMFCLGAIWSERLYLTRQGGRRPRRRA